MFRGRPISYSCKVYYYQGVLNHYFFVTSKYDSLMQHDALYIYSYVRTADFANFAQESPVFGLLVL